MKVRLVSLLIVVAAAVACGGSSSAGAVLTPSLVPTTGAASPSPEATPSVLPAFQGAMQFGINAVEQKTGLTYLENGCPSTSTTGDRANPPCLTHAIETDGENATSIAMNVVGYFEFSTCIAYVYENGPSGWGLYDALCGSTHDFGPVYLDTVKVRVTGGCARVRQGPGLDQPILTCVKNGTLVKITATPTYADGKMWWGVLVFNVGSGLMSQEFLEGAG